MRPGVLAAQATVKRARAGMLFGALVFLAVSHPPGVAAQTAADPALLAAGSPIFEQNCALCHGETGSGDPPHFPALAGNAVVGDLSRVVSNIHLGQGNMPPFPDLGAEDLAALATYIGNSWGNSAGGIAVEDVALLLEDLDGGGATQTIWDGVYSGDQVVRGRLAYDGQCAVCHGRRLNGAAEDPDMQSGPPLARDKFLRDWSGRSLAVLFDYTRASMPEANPGSLSDGQYADILAYMLSVSGAPAGETALGADQDALARITIGPQE